jgi:hypothetical protein
MKKNTYEQDLLPLDGLPDEVETPEIRAGKIANSIFRPWFKEYYEGRYTQNIAHINKVLKQFVLDVVVNGQITESQVQDALAHVGKSQQVITPLTLQYALGRVKRVQEQRANAGMNAEMASELDFVQGQMHSSDTKDYGKTGQEF